MKLRMANICLHSLGQKYDEAIKVGCQDYKNNVRYSGTLRKCHKPFEADKKMKVTKEATIKTSFLTLSGLEIMQYCGDSNPTKQRIHDVNN